MMLAKLWPVSPIEPRQTMAAAWTLAVWSPMHLKTSLGYSLATSGVSARAISAAARTDGALSSKTSGRLCAESSAFRAPRHSQAFVRTTKTSSSRQVEICEDCSLPASPICARHSSAHILTSHSSSVRHSAQSAASLSTPNMPNATSAAHFGRRADGGDRMLPPPMVRDSSDLSSALSSRRALRTSASGTHWPMYPSVSAAEHLTPAWSSFKYAATFGINLTPVSGFTWPSASAAAVRVKLSASERHLEIMASTCSDTAPSPRLSREQMAA
mmetsp:Transcript_17409/g.54713  ORF Transcript_17409/g.54713 Transcript_17409/m.54713 type:complete len:271 (-) Transcript_17409:668-1480(-)